MEKNNPGIPKKKAREIREIIIEYQTNLGIPDHKFDEYDSELKERLLSVTDQGTRDGLYQAAIQQNWCHDFRQDVEDEELARDPLWLISPLMLKHFIESCL